MTYKPKPIDSSLVVLSKEVLDLTEILAENVHEIWSQQRLNDGWKYGPRRNDARREHPCLIPYSELPESEKTYDRNTAMETLKAIIAFGYQIKKL